jgi:hypothetical protein
MSTRTISFPWGGGFEVLESKIRFELTEMGWDYSPKPAAAALARLISWGEPEEQVECALARRPYHRFEHVEYGPPWERPGCSYWDFVPQGHVKVWADIGGPLVLPEADYLEALADWLRFRGQPAIADRVAAFRATVPPPPPDALEAMLWRVRSEKFRLASTPHELLACYPGPGSPRRQRLLSAALGRLWLGQASDPLLSRAIDLVEWLADGEAGEAERVALLAEVERKLAQDQWVSWDVPQEPWVLRCRLAEELLTTPPAGLVEWFDVSPEWEQRQPDNESILSLIRDVYGSSFPPVALAPHWGAPGAAALARVIYQERAFGELPILADALEEAGCTNAAILDHCRGPGPHVRGCWVVDLLRAVD